VSDDLPGSGSDRRSAAGGGLAALLWALPAQRAGLRAAQGRSVGCGVLTAPQGTTACASCGGWEPVLGRPSADPGDRCDLGEARRDLAAWLTKWQATYPKLCDWVKEHIEETLTFYRLPRQHHEHLKSTNLLERLNEEIKRHTRRAAWRVRSRLAPQSRKQLTSDSGARSRDARDLARSAPLPQHGRPKGAQEGAPAHGGVTFTPSPLWTTLRLAHKGPQPPP
jgi:hypothetical protein